MKKKPLILVVDDNKNIRMLIKAQVMSMGYNTIEAENGKIALEKVVKERPDLILLDVMMPEKDGFAVAREIKENKQTRHIPIIMVTARTEFESKTTGIECGADDYITKPIDFKNLELKIKALLRIKELNDQIRKQKEKLEEELHLARNLHKTIHTFSIPVFKGVEISTFYEPAPSLSGDIYFIHRFSPDKGFIFLGDVTTRGVPATLIMSFFKSLLSNNLLLSSKINLSELFFNLNSQLMELDIGNNYIRALGSIFNTKEKKLNYINSAFTQGILFKKNEIKFLEQTASPLSAHLTINFTEKIANIEKGDRLLLINKGVVKMFDSNTINLNEAEKFKQFLQENQNNSTKDIIEKIKSRIEKDKLIDDVIIVGVDFV